MATTGTDDTDGDGLAARTPMRLVARALGSFHPRTMPRMARANYRREIAATSMLPFVLAPVEGGIAGVLVRTGFEGLVTEGKISEGMLNYIVAVVTASAAFANITSFVWVRASHGRDKIQFLVGALVTMAVLVIMIGLMPRSVMGLYLTAGATVLARVCWAGFLTMRSTVWGRNYPRAERGRLTGKLSTVQVSIVALLGLGLGAMMEWSPDARHVMLPLGAVIGCGGIYMWSRVRVRGREAFKRVERMDTGKDRPSFNPMSIVEVLRTDRKFAWFMLCMFLLGIGNLMVDAPLVIAVREEFGGGYAAGILVMATLPQAMMPLAIPFWARLLDKGHVVKFRAIHAWFFVAATLCLVVAFRFHLWPLVIVGVLIEGIAFGGGVLAWNLGHLDFAPAHKVSQYMGVHVTLTGVRGIIGPFAAVWMYEAFKGRLGVGGGSWVFVVCLVFAIAGSIGFVRLARLMGGDTVVREGPIEATPPSKARE
ncbi:MAG: MFS transporter [Phycisphaeraceae bacterium]|nr:MFS transporter [Phycisphaeraceae bacterium]